MSKSCEICGFFVKNETPTTGNLGYCLWLQEETDDGKETGEGIKIIDGPEDAKDCDEYYRKVKNLQLGDFINWRTSIRIFQVQDENQKRYNETQKFYNETQKRLDLLAKIIALSALSIAGLQLYLNLALR